MRPLASLLVGVCVSLLTAPAAFAYYIPGPVESYIVDEMPLVTAMKERIRAAPAPEPEPEPEPAHEHHHHEEPPQPPQSPQPPVSMSVNWDVLAECESHGEWDYGPHSGWGSGAYEGGLQFAPGTWDAYRDPGMPGAAYEASREQQIVVAERVLADQGLKAWPACTRKLGWR